MVHFCNPSIQEAGAIVVPQFEASVVYSVSLGSVGHLSLHGAPLPPHTLFIVNRLLCFLFRKPPSPLGPSSMALSSQKM